MSITESGGGALIAVGGHEDKEAGRVILREIAGRVQGGRLVLATVASHVREGYFDMYEAAFHGLGVGELVELYIEHRTDASSPETLALFDGAAGLFFTGGDQMRIASQVKDTPVEQRLKALLSEGGLVAGTSAGAAAMSQTMLAKGPSNGSYHVGDLHMAPGLGLIDHVILDQHFAERGRIGRLLGAVAQDPGCLGVGIDEDTALIIEDGCFRVIGSGGVYVVDAHGVTHSNLGEDRPEQTLSLYDVRLHLLGAGDAFDLAERRPVDTPGLEASHQLEAAEAPQRAA